MSTFKRKFSNTLESSGTFSKTQDSLLETENSPLDEEYLSVDDVLLVPKKGILSSRTQAILHPFIYSSPMDVVTGYKLAKEMLIYNEYPVLCRFLSKEWDNALWNFGNHRNIFFAVGVDTSTTNQFSYPPSHILHLNISVDIAHGDMERALDLYRAYASQPMIRYLMSGTVCTPGGALRAVEAGCTHIRVGVGSGSVCTTRSASGVGMPQLSAVYLIHKALQGHNLRDKVFIIADGGIRTPGDAVKYLAAGADGIMMGKAFSQTRESSGWKVDKDKWWEFWKSSLPHKKYRGQASRDFQIDHYHKEPSCAEGAVGPVIHPTNTAHDVIREYKGGVRSALSYLGLKDLKELNPDNVTFIKITTAAFLEGLPHGI